MSLLKSAYRVFRSIIMSLIVLLVLVYAGLYVVLSVPSVQKKVKDVAGKELSALLGGKLTIGSLSVYPFSELVLSDVELSSPEGGKCVGIRKVAAGIDLWRLLSDRRIVLNYAEIIGLDALIVQPEEGAPLNIQFLIDALSPKDHGKPPASFDLKIRNVVVRDSKAMFSRPWMVDAEGRPLQMSDIALSRLRMDLSIPKLSNDLFRFDVRKIQFDLTPGVNVTDLSAEVSFLKDRAAGAGRLTVKDLNLSLPNTSLAVGDFELQLDSIMNFDAALSGRITPADFAELVPQLEVLDSPWNIGLGASMRGNSVSVSEFILDHPSTGSQVNIIGGLKDFRSKDSIDVGINALDLRLNSRLISDVLSLIPNVSDKVRNMILSLGSTSLRLDGGLHAGGVVDARAEAVTDIGSLKFNASGSGLFSGRPKVKLDADAEDLMLGRLLASDGFGKMSFSLTADVVGFDRNAEGEIKLASDEIEIMGNILRGVDLELSKEDNDVSLAFDATSGGARLNLIGSALIAGADTKVMADVDVADFNPAAFGVKGRMADCDLSARMSANLTGDNPDNITGYVGMNDISIVRPDGKRLGMSEFSVTIDTVASSDDARGRLRSVSLNSDWLSARAYGHILPSSLVREMKEMVASVFPTLLPSSGAIAIDTPALNDFSFDINIKGESAPYVFFNAPVRPLTDIPISGLINASEGRATISLTTPHLQQGKNKLIRDVVLSADLNSFLGMAKVNTGLIFPAKKGDAELVADIFAVQDRVNLNLGINPTIQSSVKGSVAMAATFSRRPDPFKTVGPVGIGLEVLPSTVVVNDKAWTIANGNIDYSGKCISISNFLVSHDDQYVRIAGVASESPDDVVKVSLNDIDLEYIFNILNINYVSFGGMATGEVVGSRLLTKAPVARTRFLRVKGLSYNGAVLGDGDLASEYDSSAQKVGIYAVVRDPMTRARRASIDGGIWVTRDSLSFGFDADKINVGIMKPFVSAFCSDLYGVASGKCKLYGTFSDIDLVGALKADTLSMKLDFTNTWYHAGGDSVFLRKGVIDIPPLTLYDDDRHSAEFSGWLKHTYFHDPVFNFKLKDAKSLLCYDTNETMNPLWYGTIYGSGHAQIAGRPGLIEIDMNMKTEEGSKFYYIISDAEDVAQYSFLSFTDRRKESLQTQTTDSVPEYLKKFHRQTQEMEAGSSNVVLSLKGTVTNDALVTLVMDPRAGDNITARGQGALQMDYNMASNDLRMIGTYVLDEGNYYFTLQDIIIKNFNIRKGSMIKFDGDPMKANLDIAATYRVNTNLTDLDKSFSTDKELNRTNVPVDAVLLVDGPMTNPDITFDIELPSLTSDVERKVKSIVSTNDMMSRQIIYLLALNRFYTPEYTDGNNSSELSGMSSMASSTISSQLSNILSQMTDKLSVAPSFRSDKGDFTDMEFDLALSSRLLNNRLLINGNFGYRDGETSNTQFIGDFDIEYLLNKNGNLRLKAYNHFNDQNYYLRSALTTQGVGVVFRRDFDRLFGRKRKEEKTDESEKEETGEKPDSVSESLRKGKTVLKELPDSIQER